MSWEVLTVDDVLSEFTLAEAAAIRQVQGSGSGTGQPFSNMDLIVEFVIDEVRGYITAGGYTLDAIDNTIPVGLFSDAIAIARWRLLIATPAFRQLQTEERQRAFEDALKKLALVAAQQFNVEPPIVDAFPRSGNWNTENKLVMRTHPVPRPATQFTPQINTYANPSAPGDTLNTLRSGPLTVGTSYTIIFYVTGDDFANVGGVNATGSFFTATGTTPTVWTNQSQLQPQP